MNPGVALWTSLLLLALLPSLSNQDGTRVIRGTDPPWARPSQPNNYRGPPGNARGDKSDRQTDSTDDGGHPSGEGPPGLSGGGPPGLLMVDRNREKGHGRRTNFKNDEKEPKRLPSRFGSTDASKEESRNSSHRSGKNSNLQGCKSTEHEGGCVLPKQPESGNYELGGCGKPCFKQAGDKVPRNSTLTYTCRENYISKGNTISVCVNDEWQNLPSCLKTCPELKSTSVEISCNYKEDTVSCTERVKPGTRARLSCKPSYKIPLTNYSTYREIACLPDGLWDHPVFRCLPECGTTIAHGDNQVVNGLEAKVKVFPWHVSIYNKDPKVEYQQICGGTLVSSSLVVSAAHCFYDEVYNKLRSKTNFAVAAGKHYRDWNANENYAQTSLVAEISLPDRYIGAKGNFAQDIAVIKLETPFELTTLVRPICMDWDNVYEREQLQIGQDGKVVGWGDRIKGRPSETLQEVDMPFVPYDQCLSAVPDDFRGYITSDKFCAGRLNGSALCNGDSGGGLCFQKQGVWYLRGIVSVSPVKGETCDYNSYVAFTYVSYFRDWIHAAYLSV